MAISSTKQSRISTFSSFSIFKSSYFLYFVFIIVARNWSPHKPSSSSIIIVMAGWETGMLYSRNLTNKYWNKWTLYCWCLPISKLSYVVHTEIQWNLKIFSCDFWRTPVWSCSCWISILLMNCQKQSIWTIQNILALKKKKAKLKTMKEIFILSLLGFFPWSF